MPTRCRLHGLGQRRQAALALEPRFLLISDHGVPTAYLRVLKNRGLAPPTLSSRTSRALHSLKPRAFRKSGDGSHGSQSQMRAAGVEAPNPSEGGHAPVDRHISNSGNVEKESALALGFVVFAASD
jgi:hypothetical protein